MSAILSCLLQVTCISGLLYGYYHVALRNKQFHAYNRFYLLFSAVLAIVIPFLQIPVYFSPDETDNSFVLQTLTVISQAAPAEVEGTGKAAIANAPFITTAGALRILYMLIAFIILSRILFSLLRIRKIIRNNSVEKYADIRFVITSEPGTPFSFFKWLFWNRDISINTDKGEQIFRHELFHIRQKHSLDVLFMEMLTMICWINPFFHLMKKEIRAIHEFLADRYAVNENRKWEYAELLLMQAFQTRQHLVNPFFHNQIKRRIAMITTSSKPSYRYARKLMVLPLAAAAAAIFAFSYRKSHEVNVTGPTKPITVVIDAGHGGEDKGAVSPEGITEKEIVLEIARKVRELNTDPNVKIILTRESDEFPTLKARTDLVAAQKPDLFLSLHMNSTPGTTTKSGIEIFIAKNNTSLAPENKILASILLNYFHPLYSVAPVIKQAETRIWVLDQAICPAALIEFGQLQNRQDLKFVIDPNNQEKIAQQILNSIDQYMHQRSGEDWEERKKQVSDSQSLPHENGGLPKPEYHFIGKDGATTIKSDSIVFKSDPSELYQHAKKGLYVLNGKPVKTSDLAGKTILSRSLVVYMANDPKAIAKYGEAAREGVMEFENATLVNELSLQDTSRPTMSGEKVFTRVEAEAVFPGGAAKWSEYLKRNLNPAITKNSGLTDGAYTVIVQFIVNADGKISDVKTLTNHGHGLEAEAMRVIKMGPSWDPAIQNGKKVSSYRKQPVTFIVGKGEKGFRPDDAGSTNITLYNATEFPDPFYGNTDAGKLYIGINNKLKITGDVDLASIVATISSGTIEKQGEFLIAKVHTQGDVVLFLLRNGMPLKKVKFQASLLPERAPASDPVKVDIPKIGLKDLKSADVSALLQLPPNASAESFTFSIDDDKGDIHQTHNGRNVFHEETKKLIAKAKPGKIITIDNIRIVENGVQRKFPSRAYEVVD